MAEQPKTDITVLKDIEARIAQRKGADPEKSWTAKILQSGRPLAARKLGEEAVETMVEALAGTPERLVEESADLLYHWLVLMESCDVKPEAVYAVLRKRFEERR